VRVRKAATSVTANVTVPSPTPILRSALSSATLVSLRELVDVHDPVSAAAQHDHGGDCPQQNNWHGYSPLDGYR